MTDTATNVPASPRRQWCVPRDRAEPAATLLVAIGIACAWCAALFVVLGATPTVQRFAFVDGLGCLAWALAFVRREVVS